MIKVNKKNLSKALECIEKRIDFVINFDKNKSLSFVSGVFIKRDGNKVYMRLNKSWQEV